MKTTPCISASEANSARLALVLPVEAQATRRAPTMRAWVKAAVMPLSLKLPLGFSPSYCSSRLPGFMPICRPSRFGMLQDRAAFADGDDVVFGAIERQQLAEPPDAGKIEPAFHFRSLGAPAVLEEAEALGHRQPRPVVADIEQAAAPRAGDFHLVDAVGAPASGIDALLIRRVVHLERG